MKYLSLELINVRKNFIDLNHKYELVVKQERMTFHRGGILKSIINCLILETLETGIRVNINNINMFN